MGMAWRSAWGRLSAWRWALVSASARPPSGRCRRRAGRTQRLWNVPSHPRVSPRFPIKMAIEWRGPVPDSNYTVGRDGNAITLIVDHWTVVMFEAAIRRFLTPGSALSAHYVIGQDGRIAQLVSEDDTAYHAGKYDVNLRSIGIEHEAGPVMAPTDALSAASAHLHAEIASRHSLALQVDTTVLPHHAIVPTECPGTLDLDRIVRQALEEDDMFTDADRAKLDRIYQHLQAYEPLTWTKRLQQWLARAFRTQFPEADLGGPDAETGQPFKG